MSPTGSLFKKSETVPRKGRIPPGAGNPTNTNTTTPIYGERDALLSIMFLSEQHLKGIGQTGSSGAGRILRRFTLRMPTATNSGLQRNSPAYPPRHPRQA